MELECNKTSSKNDRSTTKNEDCFVVISSNWEIDNNKCFNDCISTVSLLQAPDRTSLEDIVSLDTCVALKSSSSGESCRLEFKTINKQKIARIALASEASVLEFFKQSGEYATTIFAEFIDEFHEHSVYFAETTIQPPSTEASIKFTRTKKKGTTMWIYGIKLFLTETVLENCKNTFDLDVINSFLSNTNKPNHNKIEMARKVLESYSSSENSFGEGDMNKCLQKIATMNWNIHRFQVNNKDNETNYRNYKQNIGTTECNSISLSQDYFDLKTYIDNKFNTLEKRLIERVDLMDKKTSKKLDTILKSLQLNVNN